MTAFTQNDCQNNFVVKVRLIQSKEFPRKSAVKKDLENGSFLVWAKYKINYYHNQRDSGSSTLSRHLEESSGLKVESRILNEWKHLKMGINTTRRSYFCLSEKSSVGKGSNWSYKLWPTLEGILHFGKSQNVWSSFQLKFSFRNNALTFSPQH